MGLNPFRLHSRYGESRFVAGGIGLLILWLLTRMALISWADLSFVLPVTSIGYVLGGRFWGISSCMSKSPCSTGSEPS